MILYFEMNDKKLKNVVNLYHCKFALQQLYMGDKIKTARNIVSFYLCKFALQTKIYTAVFYFVTKQRKKIIPKLKFCSLSFYRRIYEIICEKVINLFSCS